MRRASSSARSRAARRRRAVESSTDSPLVFFKAEYLGRGRRTAHPQLSFRSALPPYLNRFPERLRTTICACLTLMVAGDSGSGCAVAIHGALEQQAEYSVQKRLPEPTNLTTGDAILCNKTPYLGRFSYGE